LEFTKTSQEDDGDLRPSSRIHLEISHVDNHRREREDAERVQTGWARNHALGGETYIYFCRVGRRTEKCRMDWRPSSSGWLIHGRTGTSILLVLDGNPKSEPS